MTLNGYVIQRRGAREARILAEEAEALQAVFFEGRGLKTLPEAGRASVESFSLQSGGGILRSYRRGGAMALVLKDGYLGNRMLREFELMVAYHQEGGYVPLPLGVCWERTGLVFRGVIATQRIDGTTLLDTLQVQAGADGIALCRAAGKAIRHMHDQGVWHADLQVKNILVSGDDVYLIDFDGARRLTSLGTIARARNLLRLRRSFEKQGLSLDNFAAVCEGYGPIEIPAWLDTLYRLRGASAPFRGGANP